jgi:hypothetical protein
LALLSKHLVKRTAFFPQLSSFPRYIYFDICLFFVCDMMTGTNREPKGETNISSDMVEHAVAKEDLEIPDLDARLQQLAQEAPPFYKNRNLLIVYLLMIPGCLVPSVTLGFDSAMMNGLQAVDTWIDCMSRVHGRNRILTCWLQTLTTRRALYWA